MTLTFTPRFECVDIQPSASVALLPADASEKDAKLAQKLGQVQPFITVFPRECTGQLASCGPT